MTWMTALAILFLLLAFSGPITYALGVLFVRLLVGR